MIYPSADTIEEKVGSRYSLVVLAAKRAKQIKEGAPVLIDTVSTNPLTIALEEIAAGKVTISDVEMAVSVSDEDAAQGSTMDESVLLPPAGRTFSDLDQIIPGELEDEDAADDTDDEDAAEEDPR